MKTKIDAYHQNPLLTGDQGGIPHPPKPLSVNQKKKKIHCLQDVRHCISSHEYSTVPESYFVTLSCVMVSINNVLKLSLLLIVKNLYQQVNILIFSDRDRKHHMVGGLVTGYLQGAQLQGTGRAVLLSPTFPTKYHCENTSELRRAACLGSWSL